MFGHEPQYLIYDKTPKAVDKKKVKANSQQLKQLSYQFNIYDILNIKLLPGTILATGEKCKMTLHFSLF